jgi:hypothetical protein
MSFNKQTIGFGIAAALLLGALGTGIVKVTVSIDTD